MSNQFLKKGWVVTLIVVTVLTLISELTILNSIFNIIALPALAATTILSIPVRILIYLFIPGDSNIFQIQHEFFTELTTLGHICVILFWSAFSAFIGWIKRKIKKHA